MTWIAILFMFEVGVAPTSQVWNHGNDNLPQIVEREEVVTDVGVRGLFFDDFIFIGASVETRAEVLLDTDTWYPQGSPYRDVYQFEAGLKWRGFELGWRHECSHPVVTNWQVPGALDQLGREWAFDRFYLSYEGRVEVLKN